MRLLRLIFILSVSQYAYAIDFRGQASAETRYFFEPSPYEKSNYRVNNSASLVTDVFSASSDYTDLFRFVSYFRVDQHDSNRTSIDVRELSWIHVADNWETRVGVYKSFWGVTEGRHLVDIVNQTDLVAQPDGDEKLGQPMINLSIAGSSGILDVFLLSGFRERTFPGPSGRPRLPLTVSDNAAYESGAKRARLSGAIRYQNYTEFGLEYAVSHFSGTSRDPLLIPEPLSASEISEFSTTGELRNAQDKEFIPFYSVIDQSGLELQQQIDAWLLKLEAISRSGQGDRYWAVDTGFEYIQGSAFGSNLDIGWLAEYLHEQRETALASPFDNDILLGVRLTLNDAESTQALVALMHDLETEENVFTFEASRRLSSRFKVTVESQVFTNSMEPRTATEVYKASSDDNIENRGFSAVSRSDFVQAELVYFF
ncbi:MAG: hypothetical protein HLX50_00295 [Alteromonadaceae bacterium]|nr:hypothetical protein [Alteromonadaceae bacterium]